MSKTAIIIPARYSSRRLNAKPLIEVCNKPIIQWVWEKAKLVKSADMVIIATDNQEIYDKAKSFGAEVEMTSDKHQSGSDRIVEVVQKYPEISYVVNLQGEEPMINPDSIEEVIKLIKDNENTDIATLVSLIKADEDLEDPNMVKCVFDKDGYALYFSRSKIPYERNYDITSFYKHIGLYAYKRDSLFKMSEMEQADIEKAESLEQLRALYNGMKIKTSVIEDSSIGIDTIEDLKAFKKLVEC